MLLGGASAGAFTGCSPSDAEKPLRISSQSVYVNNYFVPGAGYYHAPFHAFFPQPYNTYDPRARMYYYGGHWGVNPYQSAISISAPTDAAADAAEAARTDIVRGGFGGSSGGFSIWS